MKKIILIIILGFILLSGILFYFKFIQTQSSTKDGKENFIKSINFDQNYKNYIAFGLTVSFPKNWEIISDYPFPISPKLKNNSNENLSNLTLFFSSFKKESGISLLDWVKQNDINSEKQDLKKIKVNNTDAIELYDYIVDSNLIGYFQPVVIYFQNGTDIYKIDYYEIPDELSSDFSSEDIKQAKDYEKAVNEIIQSIRFTQ